MVWLAIACSGLLTDSALAQVGGPPTAPTTFWNFLGIPQGVRKVQGALRNRNGNRPNREPQPPLKAIADPANLESPDKAIKKAAEIKQAEDLKDQKIKAIKYLTSVGCGCYDKPDGEVTAALKESMNDCTEDVRYETIKAIGEAAEGGCCAKCGSTCCCNKELLMELARIAYERDDQGCYVEASARVRSEAANTLKICCPTTSSPPIVEKPQQEKPETPPSGGGPEAGGGDSGGPEGGDAGDDAEAEPDSDAEEDEEAEKLPSPDSITWQSDQIPASDRRADVLPPPTGQTISTAIRDVAPPQLRAAGDGPSEASLNGMREAPAAAVEVTIEDAAQPSTQAQADGPLAAELVERAGVVTVGDRQEHGSPDAARVSQAADGWAPSALRPPSARDQKIIDLARALQESGATKDASNRGAGPAAQGRPTRTDARTPRDAAVRPAAAVQPATVQGPASAAARPVVAGTSLDLRPAASSRAEEQPRAFPSTQRVQPRGELRILGVR